MLSWVYRNRRRLMVIYGVAEELSLPGLRFAPHPDRRDRGAGEEGASCEEPVEPGRLVRRRRWTVVRPMPPRVFLWDETRD